MIDIDHYGEIEKQIIDKLYKLNYSGIILLDDVFNHPDKIINTSMNQLWNNLSFENSKKMLEFHKQPIRSTLYHNFLIKYEKMQENFPYEFSSDTS